MTIEARIVDIHSGYTIFRQTFRNHKAALKFADRNNTEETEVRFRIYKEEKDFYLNDLYSPQGL